MWYTPTAQYLTIYFFAIKICSSNKLITMIIYFLILVKILIYLSKIKICFSNQLIAMIIYLSKIKICSSDHCQISRDNLLYKWHTFYSQTFEEECYSLNNHRVVFGQRWVSYNPHQSCYGNGWVEFLESGRRTHIG